MIDLIDATYFYGDLALPFSDEASITTFFTNYGSFQRTFLVEALGEHLYKEFEDDFSGDSPATQKYKDLLNGKNYTVDNSGDFNIKYPGIIDSTNLISFLAYFYFYEYFKSNNKLTKTGWINEENENSIETSTNKVISVYNKGIELYGEVELVKQSSIDDLWNLNRNSFGSLPYFGTTPFGTNSSKNRLKGNLYNFVNQQRIDNGEDYYPQWIFTLKNKINSMNI